MPKRKDYIGWDEYFMGVALLSGARSKDPSSQVGACIVSEDNKILSIGYNGFPNGCSDDEISWEREGNFAETKYPYVCHGELNAILNYTGTTLKNSRVYVALFPCNECAKLLAQKRVGKVVYLESDPKHQDRVDVSTAILNAAGIEIQPYEELIRKEKDDEE